MVKYAIQLDSIFHSLADPIRRDILHRVAQRELSVGELVEKYDISFAAISRHLKVLETARLIRKRKEGRRHIVTLESAALQQADYYLEQYRRKWQSRHDKLESLLKEEE